MHSINKSNASSKSAPFVLTCMIEETILHICNAKQYIINNLIKVYTNFQWKFQMILDCTFCAFLHSGKSLHRESALLQKDLTWCMHSSLNTKIHFKEVYLSCLDRSHCKKIYLIINSRKQQYRRFKTILLKVISRKIGLLRWSLFYSNYWIP